jgi:adenylate cyclase
MEEDELATIETLTSHKEIMRKLIRQYRGRVVDSTGDNLLAEFGSVVDAVQCAVEVQQVLSAKNETLPENRRMYFRIGINSGDVIEEGEVIYGDGVNVAARVESLAEGGGISISGTAYDQLGKKLPLGYEYLGEQTVKNIEKPVRVYRVLPEAEAAGKVIGEKRPISRQWRWAAIGALVALIIGAGALAIWNFYLRPAIEPVSVEKMALPLPDNPSIAVLPFDNMSGDPAQDYLADGISENIISALSRISRLFVIARNSTFSYKGKPVKVQQVSEELGVRYVLEGSVQTSGERVRVTAQLIDAIKGYHLWSGHYDRKLHDMFALQDEITMKIMAATQVKLTEGEQARVYSRGTENLEAYLTWLKARDFFNRYNPDANFLCREMAEKAIDLDPKFAMAHVYLAWTHLYDVTFRVSKNPRESYRQAYQLAQKALDLDGTLADAYIILGGILLRKGEKEKAITLREKALALNPNGADVNAHLAGALIVGGRVEEAIKLFKKAIRLNPFPPSWYLSWLGTAYSVAQQPEKAVEAAEKARQIELDNLFANVVLAINYSYLGFEKQAQSAAEEILRIDPKFCIERWSKINRVGDKASRERAKEALRKAGIPESSPLPLPDKPSIAVLPFVNMSGDPEQEYFSDGITEDIITDLSKVSGLFVIARNSSFSYKGKQMKVQDVAKDLGVRYVLEGSVRRAGNMLRITAQLIDAVTGDHLWADRYDRELKDIFSVQDQVTQKVVSELAVTLKASESERVVRKHTENFEAYDLYLRIIREYWPPEKKQDYLKGLELSKRVIELDPEFGGGYQVLSFFLSMGVRFGYSTSPREDVEKALELAQKAVSLDDTFAPSYNALASAYLMKRQHQDAVAAATAAVRIEPGGYNSKMWLGFYLHWMGRGEEAVRAIKKAQQLNPKYLDERVPWMLDLMGYACFTAGRYEESIAAMKTRLDRFGPFVHGEAFLTAAYSELGREDEAKAMARQLLKRHPKFSLTSWKFARVYKKPEDTERLLDALRRVGLK